MPCASSDVRDLPARVPPIDLNTPQTLRVACLLVPACFGLYSLWLGADANWDLQNYHLYNPFAWLHGKLLLDLAPAGMQSYFNPLLDLVIYWANTHLPPWLVGFALGWLHGLSFVLILGIVRSVLTELPEQDRFRVPVLLACTGCLTANFLSGLGNTMGDDTTALLTLAGLLTLLSGWDRLGTATPRSSMIVLVAGIVVGLGVGLKLTNAVSSLALCLALLSYPGSIVTKLRISVLFGIGVLVGMATTGGYWFLHMWKLFGNPLYPQFGVFFPNPAAHSIAVDDIRWYPHGFLENVFWPIIITFDPRRAGEMPIRQITWSIVYLLLLAWGVRGLLGKKTGASGQAIGPRARMIVMFVVFGFIVWMRVFSIYRYIVAIEMLTPLVIWLALNRLFSLDKARRLAKWVLISATAIVLTGGAPTFGHRGWTDPLYHAQLPTIEQPDQTTVIIATGATGAWLATLFSPKVAFASLDSSFPGTDLFQERIRETARTRGGPVYAIVGGKCDLRIDAAARADRYVKLLGITQSERGCAALRWAADRLRLHVAVDAPSDPSRRCELHVRADDSRKIEIENREALERSALLFQRNGFDLQLASCTQYSAGIGTGKLMYRWCRASVY